MSKRVKSIEPKLKLLVFIFPLDERYQTKLAADMKIPLSELTEAKIMKHVIDANAQLVRDWGLSIDIEEAEEAWGSS